MRVVTVFTPRAHHMGTCEFTPVHVQALARQVEKFAPFAEFECMTNAKIPGVQTRPLKHGWPGWWAKMNLFDPEVPGDFLFMDLDTVIVGSLDDILVVNKLTLLRDFYRDGKKLKRGLGSGLMYLPTDSRRAVWDVWRQQPELHQRVFSRGDQFLLEKHYLNTAAEWQDEVPGQIVSWKVHCQHGVPPEARVICFHGKPRPWEVGMFHQLYKAA
jgi:hypothetical protein